MYVQTNVAMLGHLGNMHRKESNVRPLFQALVAPSIEFIMEVEKMEHSSIWIVLVNREHSSLKTSVYRKPIHTDRSLPRLQTQLRVYFRISLT
jgi:hypothetical protein